MAISVQRNKARSVAISRERKKMWCKTECGAKLMEKKRREPYGDVRIERNTGSDSKGEWNEMVRACIHPVHKWRLSWDE